MIRIGENRKTFDMYLHFDEGFKHQWGVFLLVLMMKSVKSFASISFVEKLLKSKAQWTFDTEFMLSTMNIFFVEFDGSHCGKGTGWRNTFGLIKNSRKINSDLKQIATAKIMLQA
jgi:hypothetical protein